MAKQIKIVPSEFMFVADASLRAAAEAYCVALISDKRAAARRLRQAAQDYTEVATRINGGAHYISETVYVRIIDLTDGDAS